MIRKYGALESELEGPLHEIQHIRMNPGDLTVPTDRPRLILRDNRLRYCLAIEAPRAPLPETRSSATTVRLESADGTQRVTFTFSVPLSSGDDLRLGFDLPLVLGAALGTSWRIPER